MSDLIVREADASDAEECARIYAPSVDGSTTSFEMTAPDAQEMARRIEGAQVWLVAERGGAVLGYAYGGPFRSREAYRFTSEVSVYVDGTAHGSGVGRRLYGELFERLAARGQHLVVAGITLPNEASERLHTSLGFRRVGVFEGVGWKLDGWRDVLWMQRSLGIW